MNLFVGYVLVCWRFLTIASPNYLFVAVMTEQSGVKTMISNQSNESLNKTKFFLTTLLVLDHFRSLEFR